VLLDETGKRSGRGAYLCPNPECLEVAVRKRVLERALGAPVSAEALESLRNKIEAERTRTKGYAM